MTAFVQQFAVEFLAVMKEASPYILLGFAVAALLQMFLPVSAVQRWFGTGRVRSIFVASLLGIPLPLCSCSVLPTALALRKRGARRGATLSFLISTPETGVDSIALTYGLMGPFMAVYRPFAALVSALTAGFAAEAIGTDEDEPVGIEEETCAHPGSSHDKLAEEEARAKAGRTALRDRLSTGYRGAFVELFDETSHWMLFGLVVSALISVLLPAEIVTRYLGSGPVPLLLMLVIGIPLYICASASTPIAAALMLKGLSPGAALVFLLAGPATNLGSLAILGRSLGRRVMVIYITTIAVLSLLLGALLDVLVQTFGVDPRISAGEMQQMPVWIVWSSVAVFASLLVFSFRRTRLPSEFRAVVRGLEWLLGFQITRRRAAGAAGVVVALAALSTCMFTVPPGHHGLVRRFGSPVGEPRGEGMHFKLPPPVESVELVHSEGVRRLELGFRTPTPEEESGDPFPAAGRRVEEDALFVTGDENILDAKAVLQYRVADPERYLYGFSAPEQVLERLAVSEFLDVIGGRAIDGIYTDIRREVEQQVFEGVSRRASDLGVGVEMIEFSILSVHAPPEVHAAFRDVASAQEDKQTAINIAYQYLDETLNLARGEAARQLALAKSSSVREVSRAEGESKSLALRADAYRERKIGTRTRLYLETVEDVLSRGRKIIRPGWRGSGSIDLWISTGEGETVPFQDVLADEGMTGGNAQIPGTRE